MRQVEQFYIATLYAYDQAALTEKFDLGAGYLVEGEPIRRAISKDHPHDIVILNHEALEPLMKKRLPKLLRETVLVRLVSVFEVFLIETLQEVFVARPDLLQYMFYHKQKQDESAFQYSIAQVLGLNSISELSISLIENEKRALSRKTLRKIAKYFKEYLQIDFGKRQANFGELEEIYHRRNQIVHRLGVVEGLNAKVVTTFASNSVPNNYLVYSFALMSDFAEFIASETENATKFKRKVDIQSIFTCIATISLELLSEVGEQALDRDYMFSHGTEIHSLKAILFGLTTSEDASIILDLRGEIKEVNAYIRHLKKLKRAGHLRLNHVEFQRYIGKNLKKFPDSFLDEVERNLPTTFPKDFYVQVANALKIKTKAAKHLLSLIEVGRFPQNLLQTMEDYIEQYNSTNRSDIYNAMAMEFGITKNQAFYIVSRVNSGKPLSALAWSKSQ